MNGLHNFETIDVSSDGTLSAGSGVTVVNDGTIYLPEGYDASFIDGGTVEYYSV